VKPDPGTVASRGLDALRSLVLACLLEPAGLDDRRLLMAGDLGVAPPTSDRDGGQGGTGTGGGVDGDHQFAASDQESAADRDRLIALVELARNGDSEAFGMLFDHYHGSVYRFLFHRTRSATLAEDLTSETFFRALRSMSSFRWQGKDFGAWLMTIARNLCTDHFKAGRTRLELTTEDMGLHDDRTSEGPEDAVLASLTNEVLLEALTELPPEQRDCLVMRFLQGMSIAETAAVLGRSDGAVKQLQLRGVRNLAKLMPDGIRG
jgi:RNA polymerase sigma-70 factor, ECF subfamily